MPEAGAVSVIMPTMAVRERGNHLQRALESVTGQEGVRAVPLVVVNGTARDAELVRELERRRDLRLFSLEAPGLPAALLAGRQRVDTPWFTELDDDDALLPGALAARLQALRENPACDAVITSGYLREDGEQRLNIADFAEFSPDPLRGLLRQNWMVPGAGLFRSERVGAEIFEGMPAHLEWTYAGLRLASLHKVCFLNRPTFLHDRDTPGSLWKSRECALGRPAALERILELDLPADVHAALKRRRTQACHDAADQLWREGCPGPAWRWHLRTLGERGGWRYLPFTRHLLTALWRRRGQGR